MAQRTILQITDDLGGDGEASTVLFALDGVAYEIDLNDENAERLRGALAEFVERARRTGGRKQRGTGTSVVSSTSRMRGGAATRPVFSSGPRIAPDRAQKLADMREWGRLFGVDIAARGRIPIKIEEQYDEWVAAGKPAPNKRKGRRK